MRTLSLCAAACLLTSVAFAQELSWAELARRPELWPAECVAKAEMKFDGGVTIRPGQKLTVLQVGAAEVMDRSGRVLANGWQNSAPNALKQLDAPLKAPTAQPPH